MKKKFAPLLALLVFVGCSSVPKPSPEQNNLLAGKLRATIVQGDAMEGGNGTFDTGLVVDFKNPETGKFYTLTTKKGGWIVTNRFSPGTYNMTKIVVQREMGNILYTNTITLTLPINIREGVVNNLGSIAVKLEGDDLSLDMLALEALRSDFQNDYPDTEWDSYEWQSVYSKPKPAEPPSQGGWSP